MNEKLNFANDRELFAYVRQYNLENVKDLTSLIPEYVLEYISIEEIIEKIKKQELDFILLDARSEKEYEETHIPYALNFPVLSNIERHNVGLVYARYDQRAALLLAKEYADFKINDLDRFLKNHNVDKQVVYIYCWRGGGRSKYLAKMVIDCGYKVKIIHGGIKSFRQLVNKFNSINPFPYNLIEISGLTGVGKTRILRSINKKLATIDLEHSARHFSSLFGYVPYKIRYQQPVYSQTAFENNIFSEILINYSRYQKYPFYLIESESKKVGNFLLPENLYYKLLNALSINIYANIEVRVSFLKEDYFINDEGRLEMLKIFLEKERFFKQEVGGKLYNELLSNLEENKIDSFIEKMLINYYDVKYRKKQKTPILEVENDLQLSAADEIISFLTTQFKP
ncbi:MAG: tRNA 2-selenouridine(34) synthase MnmH [Ignavibacteria bacterium]